MGDDILEGEDVMEDTGAIDDGGAMAGAEFVPEAVGKPRSDVYTLLLILTFVAFLTGIIIGGRELFMAYDVQFWVFSVEG